MAFAEFSTDNGTNWSALTDFWCGDSNGVQISLPNWVSGMARIRITTMGDTVMSALSYPFFIQALAQDTIGTNRITQLFYNDGRTSYNGIGSGSSGLFWPDKQKTAIFTDGIIWAGSVFGEIRSGGSTYRGSLQPGNILSPGIAANPFDPRFGIWKIKSNWERMDEYHRVKYENMFNFWPGELGAPYKDINNDGHFTAGIDKPLFMGDEVTWYVANDLDTMRTQQLYGSRPIGVEFQSTEFALSTDSLKDILYKKVTMINKSTSPVTNMYIGIWSDPDLGYADDDFVACDTTKQLMYVYNGDGDDPVYGVFPPAAGYLVTQTPVIAGAPSDSAFFKGHYVKGLKNSPISSFAFYINGSATYSDPNLGAYAGTTQLYNYMQGLLGSGSAFIDPLNSLPTKFPLSGDPVAHTGWYEGSGWPGGVAPGDRRMMLSVGPFTMQPADTQEIAYAYILAQGTDHINSITIMKELVPIALRNYLSAYKDITVGTDNASVIPLYYELAQNYPNPFNPSTSIRFSITKTEMVTLKVFDVLGNEVKVLVNESKNAGKYNVPFNASHFASGIYFYTLTTPTYTKTNKMVFIK
ncbi:MAG: T9SS type A sorting domain-containing protein [Ignavibacteriales bacterium]|nr:T9SS type A sorting domain-containing protein [Ignavibacteriales bacterium]